ncbi:amidohydrolase family protein [Nocardiopsis coralliicola]
MMDRQGIRSAVLNVWPGVPEMAPGAAAALARSVNEYLAKVVADSPQRFGAFAVLPFPHVDRVMAEFTHAIDVLGLDGIGMVSNYGGAYAGDARFRPLFAEAHRRNTPLFVHPGLPPSTGQPMFGLPAPVCEFPFETVRVAAQFLYSGILEDYPGLRVILPHGGGGIAYYARRLTYGPLINSALADRIAVDPVAALQRFYFDVAMVGDEFAFPALQRFAPAGRLLVGTDFPFMSESFCGENGRHVARLAGADGGRRLNALNAEALFPRLSAKKG